MKLFFFDETDSTNNRAKEYCESNGELPVAFQADHQTSGRGRLGRSFYSPEKCGIYISYAMKTPDIALDWITPFAAVAVSRTLDFFRSRATDDARNNNACQIKWVNDVFIDSKKVCGILTEGVVNPKTNRIDKIVIGIGINLSDASSDGGERFPDEIASVAGTCGIDENLRGEVVDKLSENLVEILKPLEFSEKDERVEEYKKRSNLIGKTVDVVPTVGLEEKFKAKVIDINEKCHLIVQKLNNIDGIENPYYIELSTGEVSIRF